MEQSVEFRKNIVPKGAEYQCIFCEEFMLPGDIIYIEKNTVGPVAAYNSYCEECYKEMSRV